MKSVAPSPVQSPSYRASTRRWLVAFGVITLPTANLGIFGPAGVYLANPAFFAHPLAAMLMPPLLGSVVVSAVFASLMIVLPPRSFAAVVACMLALGLALWIQGTFFLWDYGVLQGGALDWDVGSRWAWVEAVAWFLIFATALQWRNRLLPKAGLIAGSVLLIQALAATISWFQLPARPSHQAYTLDTSRLFEFSPKQNVIVVVLDSFQASTFARLVDEVPEYRQQLPGFTFYQNTTAGFAMTLGSVPNMLTGQFNRNEHPVTDFVRTAYQQSLPSELKKRGWRTELYPWVYQSMHVSPDVADNFRAQFTRWTFSPQIRLLVDVGLFRQVPHWLKPAIFRQNQWLLSQGTQANVAQGGTHVGLLQFKNRLEEASISLADSRPRFAFYHLQGPHAPFWLDENIEPARLPQNSVGYHQQARASIRLMRDLVACLQALNLYQNSLIVIAGDHGSAEYDTSMPEWPDDSAPPQPSYETDFVRRTGTPVLLIKFPGQSIGFSVSQKPASLMDIPATLLSALSLPNPLPGLPLQQLQENETRDRIFYHPHPGRRNPSYLPPLAEWVIKGHSGSTRSWHPTGRTFHPPEQLATVATPPRTEDAWQVLSEGPDHRQEINLQTSEQGTHILQVSARSAAFNEHAFIPPLEVRIDGKRYLKVDSSSFDSVELLLPGATRAKGAQILLRVSPPGHAEIQSDSLKARIMLPALYEVGQEIIMGDAASSVYCLSGWGNPEKGRAETDGQNFRWTDGRRAVMAMRFGPVPRSARMRLRYRCMPLLAGQVPSQRVRITINGQEMAEETLTRHGTYQIDFPTHLITDNVVIIAFELPDAASPAFDLKLNEDARKLGLRMESIDLSIIP